jgi:hypothetical protein
LLYPSAAISRSVLGCEVFKTCRLGWLLGLAL